MKENYTHIAVVLDRSGSMDSIKDDTIGGFNTFLKGQKEAPGEATFTLIQFDHEYTPVYEMDDVKYILPLGPATYQPRGSTALLDAIGRTISETGTALSKMREEDRPAKVVFVVITDGFENASREFSADTIKDMISCQTHIYKWEFVFLGANQDAIMTAGDLGMNVNNAMTYAANSMGTNCMYTSLNSNTTAYRKGTTTSMSWTSEDKKKQEEAENSTTN